MSLSSIARKSIGALLALGVSGSVMAQSASVAVVPATINGTTAGGPTSPTSFDIRFTQAAANNVVGFQVDLCLPGADPPGNPIAAGYTLTPASVPNVSVSCVNISAPGTGPLSPWAGTFRCGCWYSIIHSADSCQGTIARLVIWPPHPLRPALIRWISTMNCVGQHGESCSRLLPRTDS